MTTSPTEGTDRAQARFAYGPGGVPWPLLFLYLGFLIFFTWYTLEFQLPDFLRKGPGQTNSGAQEATK